MVKFKVLILTKFGFFEYFLYKPSLKDSLKLNLKFLKQAELKFSKFAISEIAKFKFQWKFSSCRVSYWYASLGS